MITTEQRAAIAQLPEQLLHEILRLENPDLAGVGELLPESARHLAAPILTLLTREEQPQQPAPEQPAPEPAPAEPVTAPTQQEPATAPAPQPQEIIFSEFDPADLVEVDPSYFAPYEYGAREDQAPGIETHLLGIESDNPRMELVWSPVGEKGSVVLYRIVAGNQIDGTPSPEGNLLAVTRGTIYEDPVPADAAYREYQVWANVGRNDREALRSQPVLVGRVVSVFPVRDVQITESQGVIEGRWRALPGYSGIRVYVSDLAEGGPPNDPGFLLEAGVDTRQFRHPVDARGVTLRVCISPEVRKPDGNVLVGQATRPHLVEVAGELQKVDFEHFYEHEDQTGTNIALVWYAPPAGSVRAYLTRTKPNDDLSWDEVPVEALEQDPSLAAPDSIHREIDNVVHGEAVETQIMWPDGWDEVYITPVAILAGRARVGRTEVLQSVRRIENAELRENVGFQLVSFDWPVGASLVRVQREPSGGGPAETLVDVTEQQYRRNGGVRLDLRHTGEDVVLTPQSIFAGQITAAEPTRVPYPGLSRYLYAMEMQPADPEGPGGMRIRVWRPDGEDLNPPSFTAVFHPARLPLSRNDLGDGGHVLTAVRSDAGGIGAGGPIMTSDSLGRNPQETTEWFVDARQLPGPGFFRVFMIPEDDPAGLSARKILTDEENLLIHLSADHLHHMQQPPQQLPPQPPVAEPEHNDHDPGRGSSRLRDFFRRGR